MTPTASRVAVVLRSASALRRECLNTLNEMEAKYLIRMCLLRANCVRNFLPPQMGLLFLAERVLKELHSTMDYSTHGGRTPAGIREKKQKVI
ncbi:hypothetical protein [Xanthomonas citri]|uniref:hypothetical protein n=2 Tax=Xanthomonas TaxID=338 RepID=UPI0011AF4240|nr:hypothetical protein [Xanthomonas citri]MEE5092634.1 hypothetical protein [Xanthomonas euvesicatoria]MCT8355466.1 hypothetical protein [Xanthomonas citri pv. anacardii]MCT8360851.1 hypothetical protein [Xanthomonas citri pv. anacardii]MCT8366780.1 hypothetical protein [Xanthomonas citri pv. anacardii]MCT8372617.1 hypothetical protein [Xanthomonas citri pv. anacardii]